MSVPSCPMIGFDPARVGEIIRLPEDHAVGMFAAVGKGTTLRWSKPNGLAIDEVLIRDRFSWSRYPFQPRLAAYSLVRAPITACASISISHSGWRRAATTTALVTGLVLPKTSP